ncbi:hypothetical protein TNCV_4142911 [Trichonephila clavipes]|nr:hypothetical protein TNCV_4142911 [Trichonephila clavipes]
MGSRTRGRPPTRWIDDVENDLKTLNIKNWQRVAVYCWIEGSELWTCNRKRKGRPDSFQAKKFVVLDDVCLARVGNHMPMMVSNYRQCSRKHQEKRTRYMRAECDVPPFVLHHASHGK